MNVWFLLSSLTFMKLLTFLAFVRRSRMPWLVCTPWRFKLKKGVNGLQTSSSLIHIAYTYRKAPLINQANKLKLLFTEIVTEFIPRKQTKSITL